MSGTTNQAASWDKQRYSHLTQCLLAFPQLKKWLCLHVQFCPGKEYTHNPFGCITLCLSSQNTSTYLHDVDITPHPCPAQVLQCFIWIIRVNWSYVFGPWSQSLLVATAVQTAGGFLTWRKLWDDSNMLRKRPIFHPCFWTSMHFDLMFYMLCLSMGYTVYCPKLYGEKRCGCMTSVQCSDLFVDFDQHYQPSWAFKAFKQQINMEKQLMI
jgi:hypothetical protein